MVCMCRMLIIVLTDNVYRTHALVSINGRYSFLFVSFLFDREFEPRSDQTKDYIQLVFIVFPLNTQH
jgi:hypothetical protein